MELVVNGLINQEHTVGRNILWKSSHFFSVTTILISPEVTASVCLVLSNIIHNHKCRYYLRVFTRVAKNTELYTIYYIALADDTFYNLGSKVPVSQVTPNFTRYFFHFSSIFIT
jgi:hypothetical protein